ncbi:Lectin receptor kinase [Quillaja saponaria]|uniref:Lectin receptor kinase n=1 Tax=Quillaja saponaria TaxID=32244 RepID=A0AAD7KR72_QUISA|nr:Lectin receptor kinase [Quillaja saponaria]
MVMGYPSSLQPFIDSSIPYNSSGRFLGFFPPETAFDTSKNQILAVEFDTHSNYWDPSFAHTGIDVNSIISAANAKWYSHINSNTTDGSIANASTSYDSSSKNLSVFVSYPNDPVFSGNFSVSYVIDLRRILPRWARIGFSASTGRLSALHNLLSWSFSSSF